MSDGSWRGLRLTSAARVDEAVAAYTGRMASAETDRGWRSGWGVPAAAVRLPREALVERLLGVVRLAGTLQRQRGRRLRTAAAGQRRRAPWTVRDRASWCWCGQRRFDDPGDDRRPWLAQHWDRLRERPAHAQPAPTPAVAA